MNWIFFTLLAVVFQTLRNAIQSQLSGAVPTAGVTLSRFILAPPFAALYVYVTSRVGGVGIPEFSDLFACYIVLTAGFQIAATSLMVLLFKQKNFAVGAGLAKSEALVAAVVGMVFFGSQLSPLGWLGVSLGALAVAILSGWRKGGDLTLKTVFIGLCCGTCFALASLFSREASQVLGIGLIQAAGWVLLWTLLLQTTLLCGYIGVTQASTFRKLAAHPGKVIAASTSSCIGSIGWFTAMALHPVAYVKTLGQVEVFTTLLIAVFWLKQPMRRSEMGGLMLIAIAAILVMWS